MGARRKSKKRIRRRRRMAGDITLNRPDGVQISVPYRNTDTVMTVKKRIHALTGQWYNICSVRTDGEAPAVCAGANKHNSLYRTLTAAGVAPRAGHELVLVSASGPGGISPLYHHTRKRFSHLPSKSKSKSKSRSKKNKVALPGTTNQNTVAILRMILTQLEEEALKLEDTGMNRDIETARLRQMREGAPDEDEIAEVRGAGFEDVRRKTECKT